MFIADSLFPELTEDKLIALSVPTRGRRSAKALACSSGSHHLVESPRVRAASAAPILVKKNHKKPQRVYKPSPVKHEKYALAVRCSCNSVWCPKCFKKYSAPRQAARMQRMDWRRTRMVTLTLNPANWLDGEDAYVWYRLHSPIGYFIQNLGRAGVVVTDWTCNMEWHDNGFPHWHLMIEVDKPGPAGMIGEKLIHQLWSWGGLVHRIHESPFRSEKHFKKFTGYFAKSGYLHKDKQHQIELPGWASGQGWAGQRIPRFTSKRGPITRNPETEPDETAKRLVRKLTYAAKHEKCGHQVEIWEMAITTNLKTREQTFIRSKIGVFNVSYDLVVQYLDGEFYESVGYSLEGTTKFVCHVLKAWEKAPPAPPETRKPYQEALPLECIDLLRERHRIAYAAEKEDRARTVACPVEPCPF